MTNATQIKKAVGKALTSVVDDHNTAATAGVAATDNDTRHEDKAYVAYSVTCAVFHISKNDVYDPNRDISANCTQHGDVVMNSTNWIAPGAAKSEDFSYQNVTLQEIQKLKKLRDHSLLVASKLS